MQENSASQRRPAFPDLREVDRLIRETLRTPCGVLQEMVDYLLQSSGKKLRPLLVILAAAIFQPPGRPAGRDDVLQAAAAVELIHTASLVHDDIIDGAGRRRGLVTLHRRWDERAAALVGDYLLARAFYLLSSLENNMVLPLLARSVTLLCRGEAKQLEKAFDWDTAEADYFHCNYLKTSQFLAACCETGGRLAGASPAALRALREYGFNLGQAFQVVDDILDYTEQPEKLGKPVGIDLIQGTVTLPLIYLLRQRRRYRIFLKVFSARRPSLPPAVREQLWRAVRSGGALRYASWTALQRAAAAQAALQALPDCPARGLLGQVAEGVIRRIPEAALPAGRLQRGAAVSPGGGTLRC